VLQKLASLVLTAEYSVLSIDTASKLFIVAISSEESFARCCCKSLFSSHFASHTLTREAILTQRIVVGAESYFSVLSRKFSSF